jgi:hypothetical protein
LAGCEEAKRAGGSILHATQPPVELSLTPFTFFSGYYVNIRNTSEKALTDVTVTYTSVSGTSVSQQIGALAPHQSVTLDPSDIKWRVVKNEQITVSASGCVPKVLATNSLIQ